MEAPNPMRNEKMDKRTSGKIMVYLITGRWIRSYLKVNFEKTKGSHLDCPDFN